MASRRRVWADDGKRASDFPKFRPGDTTHNYVMAYLGTEGSRHLDLTALGYRAAPFITGPEAIEDTQV
jgi:hypothetical protein